MINYIGKSLNSPNENIKYSGLYVFKSLLSTIHKENFYPIVLESLAVISDILINNYPPHLKKLCSIIMKSITNEYAKQLINDNSYFDKLIELFLNIINTPSISSMEVTYDIILSINNLCKFYFSLGHTSHFWKL